MSFEGYYQILCKNGHYHSCDCYENPVFTACTTPPAEDDPDPTYDIPPWKCVDCGELAAWWNLVDVTNGSYCVDCDGSGCKWCDEGRIDGYIELEEKEPSEFCTCDKCGLSHVVKQPTYRVPGKDKRGHSVNAY